MDIKRSQIASDRTVISSRDMASTSRSGHVRFEEIEQTQPSQAVQDKLSEDIADKQLAPHEEKPSQDDIQDSSDLARFFAVRVDDTKQESKVDFYQHVRMMRERINETYVSNDKAAKTEAVLRDIHKYQQKTHQNNPDAAGKAIDLLA